jgi:hypothetical protein
VRVQVNPVWPLPIASTKDRVPLGDVLAAAFVTAVVDWARIRSEILEGRR